MLRSMISAGSVEVILDLNVASPHARAWGDPLSLDLVAGSLEEGPELLDLPIVRFGGT